MGSAECVREQQYRYGEPEWSLDEKPKIEFTTFIQPLTLSRRFLTPRKVTPEVFQWLVSRAPDTVVSLDCIWLRAGPWVHSKTVQKKP